MAVNTGNNKRIGIVKNRRQYYNSKTKRYIKVNIETGKILSSSKDKYKNIPLKSKK